MRDVTHPSFEETLAAQLRRAPYLLASLLVHAAIGFVLASLMLLEREVPAIPVLTALAPPPPLIEDKKPEPDPPPVPVVDPEPVPVSTEADEADEVETPTDGDPDMQSEDPFEAMHKGLEVGFGGPPGGNHGGPAGKSRGGPGLPVEQALADALQWLAIHQDPAGFWDADEFMLRDRWPEQPPSDGKGNPAVDVGLTGLALLAFLGDGNTMSTGPHRDVVARAVTWLAGVQRDDGLYGEEVGNPTLYNHAIATLAMAEAYGLSGRSPALRGGVQRAVAALARARNPYGAWRYALEPNGDNDTSITGWAVFALKAAAEAGIPVDKGCFDGALAWLDSMTEAGTGRTGYAWGDGGGGPGSLPSRPTWASERFPAERSEALTAVALLCRIFLTDVAQVRRWEDHPQHALLARQARLILAKPPRWDLASGTNDFYYWYYATYAMNQWGGQAWKDWERALGQALLPAQRRENARDNFHGSWDPADPWGEDGGRVYSTAICALMLEVYYRYARVLGAR